MPFIVHDRPHLSEMLWNLQRTVMCVACMLETQKVKPGNALRERVCFSFALISALRVETIDLAFKINEERSSARAKSCRSTESD